MVTIHQNWFTQKNFKYCLPKQKSGNGLSVPCAKGILGSNIVICELCDKLSFNCATTFVNESIGKTKFLHLNYKHIENSWNVRESKIAHFSRSVLGRVDERINSSYTRSILCSCYEDANTTLLVRRCILKRAFMCKRRSCIVLHITHLTILSKGQTW